MRLSTCVCIGVVECLPPAGLDVDRVCREVDVQALQKNISNVTFCNVESEVY